MGIKSIFGKILKGIDIGARFDIPIVSQIDAVIDAVKAGKSDEATEKVLSVKREIEAIGKVAEKRSVLRTRMITAGIALSAPYVAMQLGVEIPLVSVFLQALVELLLSMTMG
jgi:hypothetical protein